MSNSQEVDRDSAAFFGRVAAEWVDDRQMVLMESFFYRDSGGEVWHVPENAEVDGASIPRALWSLVGSPFVGRYRQASVVHDYHCRQKAKPAADVHRMFYEACLTAGVHPIKARLMHKAVSWFGPCWKEPASRKH